ncbi:MAG: hypothetical protein R8N24_00475 [Alphaproteobacteria bacterium]|nr:hypothetical protein [Alphaproteobacteria bacterium]
MVKNFEMGVQALKSGRFKEQRETVNIAEILRGYGLSLGMPESEN